MHASSFNYELRPEPVPAPAPAAEVGHQHTFITTRSSCTLQSVMLTWMQGSEPLSSSLKRDEKIPDALPLDNSHRSSSGASSKPLQPILKKSNSSSHGETQKTTRLLLTEFGGQSVTRKPSNPPTPIPPSKPVAFGEQQQQQQGAVTRPSQKKTFSVASKAKGSKRRPVLMRRKSSQQSSFSASSTRNHSPQSPSPPVARNNRVLDTTWLEDEIDEEVIQDSPEGKSDLLHSNSQLTILRSKPNTQKPSTNNRFNHKNHLSRTRPSRTGAANNSQRANRGTTDAPAPSYLLHRPQNPSP